MRDDRPDILSRRQLSWLLWTAMLTPLVRQAPGAMLPAAGRAAWLSSVLAAPVLALMAWALGRFLRARRPGEGLGELLCRALGRWPGRGAALLCAAWLAFSGGFTLRSGADRFVAAVYPESPAWLFIAVMLLISLPAGLGRVKTLGRCAEIAAPLLLGMFALVFALALPELDFSELWPLRPGDLPRAGLGALPLAGTLSAAALFALLAGRTEPGELGGSFLSPLLGLAGLALVLSVTVVGSFGAELAGQMDYPFFVMIRNVQLMHLLERIEALVAAAWVVSDFLLVGAQLQMASAALTLALRGPGRERTPWIVWLCAAGMGAGAWLCAPTAFALQTLGRRFVPMVHLGLALGLLPAAYIIGRLRKTL